MSDIFISYRPDDAAGYAARLYDQLSARFGCDHVLMDLDKRLPGADLSREIEWTVGACDVLLAVIGPQWMAMTNGNGQRRLDDPHDLVRMEIVAAIKRGVRVIPVLIPGAVRPQPTHLPRPLRKLCNAQPVGVSSRHFNEDVALLIEQMELLLARAQAETDLAPKPGIKLGRSLPPYLPDEPYTVLVSAGPYYTGEFHDYHTATLPGYRIGRFPVTVGEYRAFLAAHGYAERQYWSMPGWQIRVFQQWTAPACWEEPQWTGDEGLPVVGVSWYEADAYCRWLSELTKRPYRLPSGAEWEKAARGQDGRKYPWGNASRPDLCNTSRAGIGQTSPVGSYSPAGDSPCGAADLSGNVAEWCLPDATGAYTARGGSWADTLYDSRAAHVVSFDPEARLVTLGFRVVQARAVGLER